MAGDPAAAELTLQRVLEMEPTHPEAIQLAESLRQNRQLASLPR